MPVPKPSLRTLFLEALDIEDAAQRAAYLDRACGSDAVLRRQVEELIASNAEASGFLTRELAAGAGQTPMEADPHPSVTAPLKEPLDPNQLGPLAQTVLAPGAFVGIDCKPGDTIGRYKLLEKLGEGGFGVVYMAEQREPVRRKVALKIIKVGMDTREVVARFEAERQALALMDHPNIAKILDGGATGSPHPQPLSHPMGEGSGSADGDSPSPGGEGRGEGGPESPIRNPKSEIPSGRPYFVMELVRGIRITDFCDQNHLGLQERLELFMQVCHAVQHAHQKGIIHRDLKPSNILVTINDGVPVPKVIDFGIAKATQQELTEKTLFTAYGQFMGTPAYMSPEQTVMTSLDIDTRSDIYSLGVLLYELLTGKPPFDTRELLKIGLDELCRTLREVEPPRPSTRMKQERLAQLGASAKSKIQNPKSQIATDLDWIVMKCLEKDRARRYETANGLAADLQRHLSNEPVVARPPSVAYRFQKLVRRNKLAFAAGVAVATALFIGIVISTWQAVRATKAEVEQSRLRIRAQTEAARSKEVSAFLREMLVSARPRTARDRDTGMMRVVLDKATRRLAQELQGQPEVRSEIRQLLGRTYYEMGAYDQAEKLFREEIAWLETNRGEANPYVANLSQGLAMTLQKSSRFDEAEPLMRRALVLHQKYEGSNTFNAACDLRRLGELLHDRGKVAEAEETLRASLAICEQLSRTTESRDVQVLRQGLLHDFSAFVEDQGNRTQAVFYAEQALELARTFPGHDGPSSLVADELHWLGNLALRAKDYARAEQMSKASIEMYQKQFADNSWMRAHPLEVLAQAYREQDQRAKAEELTLESLSLLKKFPGADDKLLYTMLHNFSLQLENERRFEEALGFAEQALALTRDLHGRGSAEEASELLDVGNIARRMKDYARATQLLAEGVALRRKRLGDDGLEIAGALYDLGAACVGGGDRTNTLALWRETAAIMRRHPGANDRLHLRVVADLAIMRREDGDTVESDKLIGEALPLERRLYGADSPKVAVRLNELVANAYFRKDYAQAHRSVREGLAIVRKNLTNDDVDATEAFNRLTGIAYQIAADGPREEGVMLARDVMTLERARLAGNPKSLSTRLKEWAQLFTNFGMLADAEQIFREQLEVIRSHLPPEHDETVGTTALFARLLTSWAWGDRTNPNHTVAAIRASEAERLLRECLGIRIHTLAPANSNYWRVADTRSRLGFAVAVGATIDPGLNAEARLAKLAEAELLLLESNESVQREKRLGAAYKHDALQRLVRLYETWDELTPNTGKAGMAAEWRQKLNDFEKRATKPAGAEP